MKEKKQISAKQHLVTMASKYNSHHNQNSSSLPGKKSQHLYIQYMLYATYTLKRVTLWDEWSRFSYRSHPALFRLTKGRRLKKALFVSLDHVLFHFSLISQKICFTHPIVFIKMNISWKFHVKWINGSWNIFPRRCKIHNLWKMRLKLKFCYFYA